MGARWESIILYVATVLQPETETPRRGIDAAVADPQRAAPYLGAVSMYALMNAAASGGTIEFPIPRIVSALDAASVVRPSASRKGIPVIRGEVPG